MAHYSAIFDTLVEKGSRLIQVIKPVTNEMLPTISQAALSAYWVAFSLGFIVTGMSPVEIELPICSMSFCE